MSASPSLPPPTPPPPRARARSGLQWSARGPAAARRAMAPRRSRGRMWRSRIMSGRQKAEEGMLMRRKREREDGDN
eukprot:8974860-Pyramimonas_sp.AAC.1